jgi:hypothetical protein
LSLDSSWPVAFTLMNPLSSKASAIFTMLVFGRPLPIQEN